jgi:hypothetical protein
MVTMMTTRSAFRRPTSRPTPAPPIVQYCTTGIDSISALICILILKLYCVVFRCMTEFRSRTLIFLTFPSLLNTFLS